MFVDDRSGPAFRIPLEQINDVMTNGIIEPGRRALNVTHGAGSKEAFWTGKRFAVLMENAIQLNPAGSSTSGDESH